MCDVIYFCTGSALWSTASTARIIHTLDHHQLKSRVLAQLSVINMLGLCCCADMHYSGEKFHFL